MLYNLEKFKLDIINFIIENKLIPKSSINLYSSQSTKMFFILLEIMSKDQDDLISQFIQSKKFVYSNNMNINYHIDDFEKFDCYLRFGFCIMQDNGKKSCIISNINALNIIYPIIRKENLNIILKSQEELSNMLLFHFRELHIFKAKYLLNTKFNIYTANQISYSRYVNSSLIFQISMLLFTPVAFYMLHYFLYFISNIGKMYLFRQYIKYKDSCFIQSCLHSLNRPLPLYSIIVPLFKEASIVPNIVASINKLDYPKDKLEVKLVVEEDDFETINAIKNISLDKHFHLIKVPYGKPRTKPRALNYAMNYIQGEYLVIFDAEDRPEANQLKKAVSIFQNSTDNNLACIQARLSFYNYNDNILTRLFNIEYIVWFNFILPIISKLNLPITLGGTSNHFQVSALHNVGYWDAYNVTEDAEIGIRLYHNNYKIGVFESDTYEEAPTTIINWLMQRSRWVKGFLQTYLSYIYNYTNLCKAKNLYVHIFFLSTSYLFLMIPITAVLNICFIKYNAILFKIMNILCVFATYCTTIYILNKKRLLTLMNLVAIIITPIYFILHSIASIIAVFELIKQPFKWYKTVHGQQKK